MSDPGADLILSSRPSDLGHGLRVQRVLPSVRRRMVGPFIFLDHAGPVVLPPDTGRQADVRPHPHIGLATVSYLLGGEIVHRDSLGVQQTIRPGEVNWMTAGRGIVHSERFEGPQAFGGAGLELLQSWVALPEADEEIAPGFEHCPLTDLPTVEQEGAWLRLIAGEAFGLRSPVQTRSPLFYLHARLEGGARLALPTGHAERAAYLAQGVVEVGGQRVEPGHMIVFGQRTGADLRADAAGATLMLLGGEPVGERFIWWNFVSSRQERIEQARADWRAGRFALPPDDRDDLVPLPEGR